MGREILSAMIEQKGSVSTNDDNPSTSRPIQQIDTVLTSSQPVQQLSELSTAEYASSSISRPVEQRSGASFNEAELADDDCFIEQVRSERNTDENPDTPIEQVVFVTANLRDAVIGQSQLVEQRIVSRDTVGDEPIEQVSKKTNQITVTQYDFLELVFPPCGSIKNPITTSILWRIKDFGSEFDVETLVFIVNGVEVQDTAEFTVTPIVGGLQLEYDPPGIFDYDSLVQIQLFISDNADPPNEFYYRCEWQTVADSRPPVIDLISPACNSTGVDVKEPVVVQIIDVGDGVDLDSVVLSIEGLPVCSGLSFDSITTASGNGYTVTWTHDEEPFRYDANITVSVEATDLSPLENSGFFVCSFDTETSSLPEFSNFDPEACETNVDNATGLTFEIYGDIDGVDITTLEVRIDNKLRKVYVRPRVLRSE